LEQQKKINVLVIPDLFPEDETDMRGVFVLDYLKASEMYCNNTVLVLKLSGKQKGLTTDTYSGSKIVRLALSDKKIKPFLKPFYYFRYFRRGCRLALQQGPIDIIHAHGSILSGTVARRLSSELKVPYVITEHAGPFSQVTGSYWKLKWTRKIIEGAAAVLNVSQHAREEILKAGIRMKSSFVTYNPVDTGLFLPGAEKADQFLFVARLDAFKGALRTVKAFRLIHAKHPGWKLVIIGEGEESVPIKKFLSADPAFASRVVLKGYMTKSGLAAEMARSRFLVFPSLHESFGLVAAEALSCGIPVIATNRTAPKEIVNDSNGLLVDPESVEDISKAINSMVTAYKKFDAAGIRSAVLDKVGLTSFGERLNAIYLDSISNFRS
jgi:glycosyltransferase involved in cell wall biosynthesis